MSVTDKNQNNAVDEKNDSSMEEAQAVSEKPDPMEDVSDVSDSVDGVAETLQLDSEDRDASPVNLWILIIGHCVVNIYSR